MKSFTDKKYELERANQYKERLNRGESDGGDNWDRYQFHLVKAETWDTLIEEGHKRIDAETTRVGAENFYKSRTLFYYVLQLSGWYKRKGDKKEAKKWVSELIKFDTVLDFELRRNEKDFSDERLIKLDKELEEKREPPLRWRLVAAERLRTLGDVLSQYENPTEARRIYEAAARLLEPYVQNVEDKYQDSNRELRRLYYALGWFESSRKLLIHKLSKKKPDDHELLELSLLSEISQKNSEANFYHKFAADKRVHDAVHDWAHSTDYNILINAAFGVYLYKRAGEEALAKKYAEDIIPPMKEHLPIEELIRIYLIINEKEPASSLAANTIKKLEKEIKKIEADIDRIQPIKSDKDRISSGPFNKLGTKYLAKGFCEESLQNFEGAQTSIKKAQQTFETATTVRNDIWDDFTNWSELIQLCKILQKKIDLKKKDSDSNLSDHMTCFISFLDGVDTFSRLSRYMEIHDFYSLLKNRNKEIFNLYETENTYWKVNESEFINYLKGLQNQGTVDFKNISKRRKIRSKLRDFNENVKVIKLVQERTFTKGDRGLWIEGKIYVKINKKDPYKLSFSHSELIWKEMKKGDKVELGIIFHKQCSKTDDRNARIEVKGDTIQKVVGQVLGTTSLVEDKEDQPWPEYIEGVVIEADGIVFAAIKPNGVNIEEGDYAEVESENQIGELSQNCAIDLGVRKLEGEIITGWAKTGIKKLANGINKIRKGHRKK